MAEITLEQALDRQAHKEIDFEKLLDPYREGGPAPDRPVPRTWGSLITWLVIKHHVPVETAGAAILLICFELRDGKVFEGVKNAQGQIAWGSKGWQLAQHLKQTAVEIEKKKLTDLVFQTLGKKLFVQLEPMITEHVRKKMKPWWKVW